MAGFVLFWALQIIWLPMTFSMTFSSFKTLGLAVMISFKNSNPKLVLERFSYLKQFNRLKLWSSPKCMPFTLLNYSSLSYIVLALRSVVNNLSNRTLIFHDFKDQQLNSMTFQAWKWNSYISWLSSFSMTCTKPVWGINDVLLLLNERGHKMGTPPF